MKIYSLVACFFLINTIAYGQDKIPSKTELDSVMLNAVKQMNSQMAGTKIDEYTTFKFVTYDSNSTIFSYFYSSNVLSLLKQNALSQIQIDSMKKFNTTKTCSTNFKPLMRPYNLSIHHIFEDKNTGKIIYKLALSHQDC